MHGNLDLASIIKKKNKRIQEKNVLKIYEVKFFARSLLVNFCSLLVNEKVLHIKGNKKSEMTLFVVGWSIKKLFSIDCVNIDFSESMVFADIYFFSVDFE